MSKDDPSFKRLSTILILFVAVLIFNGLQVVFFNEHENYDKLMGITNSDLSSDTVYPPSDETREETLNRVQGEVIWTVTGSKPTDLNERSRISIVDNSALSFFSFFFGGFLLKSMTLPLFMSIIITPIYIILLIAFWYLIIDFIKDIEILGSSV